MLISVIIPNYNHAKYLPVRIESVLAQSFQDIEVIILDDQSTDGSRDIIEGYRNHPKISQIIYNTENSGSTFRQWNKGISLASGKYVWIAESDDIAAPLFLETLARKMESDSSIGLAYCESIRINEAGKSLGISTDDYHAADTDLWKEDFVKDGHELIAKYMINRNIIPNASAVLMRRSVLLEVGAAPEDMRVTGDWIFWIRFLLITKIAFVAKNLNFFRFHAGNVRSQTVRNGTVLLETAKVLRFIKSKVEIDKKFFKRAINEFMEKWLHSFIYYNISFRQQRAIINEMEAVQIGFKSQLRIRFFQFLVRNHFSGAKILIMDKLLNRKRMP